MCIYIYMFLDVHGMCLALNSYVFNCAFMRSSCACMCVSCACMCLALNFWDFCCAFMYFFLSIQKNCPCTLWTVIWSEFLAIFDSKNRIQLYNTSTCMEAVLLWLCGYRFIRRLVYLFKPSKKVFSVIELIRDDVRRMTVTGLNLIEFLTECDAVSFLICFVPAFNLSALVVNCAYCNRWLE